MGMGLDYTVYPKMNVSLSYKVVLSLEERSENEISTIWQRVFISIKTDYIES